MLCCCSKDMITPSDRKLFCFDFDQTLVNGHFHNTIVKAKVKTRDAMLQLIESLLVDPTVGLKNPKEVKDIMQSALRNGHAVAIVSFTSFPECFVPTLTKLGLSPDEIAQIGQFHGFPSHPKLYKNEHIAKAMDFAGITNKQNVYLIDDDPQNCAFAEQIGCHAIVVPSEKNAPPFYLHELRQIAATNSSS